MMGRLTEIAWTDHTFNPVRGCRHATLPDGSVSPACVGCYAEAMAKRNPATLGEWGPDGARVFGSESYWRQPTQWNAAAAKDGVRRRVFCASLGDIFEGERMAGGGESWTTIRPDYLPMLARLYDLIEATPHLDWLLLTKRPWYAVRWAKSRPWPVNAWIGATVENQATADDRIPWLLQVPARVRFLSMEPLFGRVDLHTEDCRTTGSSNICPACLGGVGWIILGGQSGPNSALLDLDAVRDVKRQCEEAGVPVFVKQLGTAWARANGARHPKGGDMAEWPEDLRVREYP